MNRENVVGMSGNLPQGKGTGGKTEATGQDGPKVEIWLAGLGANFPV